MTASGTWSSSPGPVTAARPTAPLSLCPVGAFLLSEGVRLRVASAAAALCLSEYRSVCRWPAVAAGSSAIRGQADGAGSSWATAAAALGKPRGGRNSRVPGAVQRPSRCPAEPDTNTESRLRYGPRLSSGALAQHPGHARCRQETGPPDGLTGRFHSD